MLPIEQTLGTAQWAVHVDSHVSGDEQPQRESAVQLLLFFINMFPNCNHRWVREQVKYKELSSEKSKFK